MTVKYMGYFDDGQRSQLSEMLGREYTDHIDSIGD